MLHLLWMPCTVKKTLDLIDSTNNYYVVTIKRNYKYLYNLLKARCSRLTECVSYYKEEEKGKKHGRHEIRRVHVFESDDAIIQYLCHIKSVIRVERERITKTGKTTEIVYLISNRELSAKEFCKGIRNHWGIENRLHWVKDVVLKEDGTYYNKRMVESISVLKSFVVTLAYQNSSSVTGFQRTVAQDVEQLCLLLE